jgi:hypothetical protein
LAEPHAAAARAPGDQNALSVRKSAIAGMTPTTPDNEEKRKLFNSVPERAPSKLFRL